MRRLLLLVTGLLLCSLVTSAQIMSDKQFGLGKAGSGLAVDANGVISVTLTAGIPYYSSLAGLSTASADVVEYDGSKWYKSPGTVDTNPENNGKYTATQYNAGSSHYDRRYLDYANFSWWKNANGSTYNQMRYAISIAGIRIQVEDGIYNFTDAVWTPGNFTLRGNLTDPSKVIFNATGSETRIFRGWFWYDGVSAGQIFENIRIEGFTFNQLSTATINTSYGPITFEGASSRNITVRRNFFNNPSTSAITNGFFVKAGANKLIRDILFEDNVGTGGRIGIEVINQDNHPNNDQTVGYGIIIRRNDMGGYDYNYSIAGNFKNTLIDDNLVGSCTSYGIELAGSNINATVSNNRFYGTQNILIASNYLGENGTAQGDYAITGGQKFINNRTLGYVIGNVEIRGAGAMQFNGNDFNISGGLYFKKTQFGGVTSSEFKYNHIVSSGIGSTPNQALLYLDGASNLRAFGNTLERTGSASTALIQASGTLSSGSFIYQNTLSITSGSYFGLANSATWTIGANYTPTGTTLSDGEQIVATFALAKAAVVAGIKETFLITNNELYNASTRSYYDGTNWYHSPAQLQNN